MGKPIKVLDKGYIRLVDHMGNDLRVVNTARASFSKLSKRINKGDKNLLRFLHVHEHTAPMRSCMVTFEVRASLFVARQWYKHVIASDHGFMSWNEASFRYQSQGIEFHSPDTWREAPENMKQGSGDFFGKEKSKQLTTELDMHCEESLGKYMEALKLKVAPEQARLFLPANGQFTTWYWTGSLQAMLNFLSLRLDSHAQWEIQQYAKIVNKFIKKLFPINHKYYMQISDLRSMMSAMIKSDKDFAKVKELLSQGIK